MRDRNSDIQVLAYSLWEKAGRPQDRDLEFWLKAERWTPWYGMYRWVMSDTGMPYMSNMYWSDPSRV